MTGKRYSPAGIHRALALLLGKGMLHKHGPRYQLRTEYLHEERERVQGVLDRYMRAGGYQPFLHMEERYVFDSLSLLDLFWNALVEKWFRFYPAKVHAYLQMQSVPWFALLHFDEERRITERIAAHCTGFRTYSLDCPLARQLKPLYDGIAGSSLTLLQGGTDIGHAYCVFGDHVIETRHPAKITDVLQGLATQKESIPYASLIALSEPGSYEITVSKNKKRAEELRAALPA